MSSIAFVSSFYRINKDPAYGDAIIERFKILTKYVPIYLLCSEEDKELVENIENVTPIYKEFREFDTYNLLASTRRLPEIRNMEKDTKEYMILMNMKSECINETKKYLRNFSKSISHTRLVSHFIWIDAGISKIFKDPQVTFSNFMEKIKTTELPTEKIIIPGCWGHQTNLLVLEKAINWRFCGGFLIVPTNLVEHFFLHNLQACGEIKGYTNKVLWEVNVWAYMEPSLPIEWRMGDHNESILTI
jgi:hypothetical protein